VPATLFSSTDRDWALNTGGVFSGTTNTLMLLKVDELPQLLDQFWQLGTSRWNWARFKRSDYVGDPNTPLDEAVKSKINDPQYSNLTLYGISLYCGFKNKSTFYKVFKEITGLTPKIFMEKYR